MGSHTAFQPGIPQSPRAQGGAGSVCSPMPSVPFEVGSEFASLRPVPSVPFGVIRDPRGHSLGAGFGCSLRHVGQTGLQKVAGYDSVRPVLRRHLGPDIGHFVFLDSFVGRGPASHRAVAFLWGSFADLDYGGRESLARSCVVCRCPAEGCRRVKEVRVLLARPVPRLEHFEGSV